MPARHLRNHGFLRRTAGWALAPAFDVNPNPDFGAQRVTAIGGAGDPAGELHVLMSYAPLFDLTGVQARKVLSEVADAAARWEGTAREHGISRDEIRRFEPVLTATVGVVAEAGANPAKG